jgi:hypothetical protein
VSSKQTHDDLKALANGINHVLTTRFQGSVPEFMLILVRPDEGGEHVTLNTITGITEPGRIRLIGEHLVDMANAHGPQELNPDDDSDIHGHA